MKKLFLLAITMLTLSGCTDETCWKCELTSAEPVIHSYVITDKYVDCSVDIERMIAYWMERGKTGSVKCTNLNNGEILTNED